MPRPPAHRITEEGPAAPTPYTSPYILDIERYIEQLLNAVIRVLHMLGGCNEAQAWGVRRYWRHCQEKASIIYRKGEGAGSACRRSWVLSNKKHC